MKRRSVVAGLLGSAVPASAQQAAGPVDLQIVLAVDVSRSIDDDEARLQRQGYREAMADPQVLAAIAGGTLGAIAVAYVEWAGFSSQELILPWTRLGTAQDAASWSARLAASPRQSRSWTSLSGALRFAGKTLESCPWEGTRRVVDVSGDGVNNNGPPAEPERDRLVADGVVINGLPIVNDRPNFGQSPTDDLEGYYRGSVIGGGGSFLIVATDFASFGDAIRRKLIQEIV